MNKGQRYGGFGKSAWATEKICKQQSVQPDISHADNVTASDSENNGILLNFVVDNRKFNDMVTSNSCEGELRMYA